MKISKAHLKRLKKSKELRGKKLSTISLIKNNWKFYLVVGSIFGIASYFQIKDGSSIFAVFLGGAFFGMILRDITWFRLTTRFWPISDAVTDWEKIDEFIEENESD